MTKNENGIFSRMIVLKNFLASDKSPVWGQNACKYCFSHILKKKIKFGSPLACISFYLFIVVNARNFVNHFFRKKQTLKWCQEAWVLCRYHKTWGESPSDSLTTSSTRKVIKNQKQFSRLKFFYLLLFNIRIIVSFELKPI